MIIYPDTAQAGQPFHVNAKALAIGNGLTDARAWEFFAEDQTALPGWLTLTEYGYNAYAAAEGTPPEPGTVSLVVSQSSPGRDATTVTFTVEAGAVEVTADPPIFDTDAGTIVIPDLEGVAYRIDGTTVAPGTIDAAPGTVTVTAEALEGYALTGPAEWSEEFPEPDAEDPAYAAWILATARRVATLLGKSEHGPTLDMADMSVRLVAAYAEGYTRSRGWAATGVPVPGIAAVVTIAAVRLASNPRQVTYYQTGDYSERPAVLAGWTAAEVQVLRRYRRVWV